MNILAVPAESIDSVCFTSSMMLNIVMYQVAGSRHNQLWLQPPVVMYRWAYDVGVPFAWPEDEDPFHMFNNHYGYSYAGKASNL